MDQSAPGIEMDKMAHYRKTSIRLPHAFMRTLTAALPRQSVCHKVTSTGLISLYELVFNKQSGFSSVSAAVGPCQFLNSVPERERFKNLSFTGQHAVGSKAGVVKSM